MTPTFSSGIVSDRTAPETSKAFSKDRLNYFGPTGTLLSDGGSEFNGEFEQGCERWSSLHLTLRTRTVDANDTVAV